MNEGMASGRPVVLIDVDNTLLDNDRVQADLGARLEAVGGTAARERYWILYDALRDKLGYTDYLGALRELAEEATVDHGDFDRLTAYLMEYPFTERLYPRALEVLHALKEWALPVIVSDGDKLYQPRKILRSGLSDAVDGRVLVFVHKEEMQDEIDRLYPAPKHAMVDDKLRILTAMKAHRGERMVTVFVRQGHYAFDPSIIGANPPADVSVDHIGDLLHSDLRSRLEGGPAKETA